jgi:predicted CopG family antitoxin
MPKPGFRVVTIPEHLYHRLEEIKRREPNLVSISDVIEYLIASYEGIKVVAPTFNVDATKDSVNNYVKELRRRLGLDNTPH